MAEIILRGVKETIAALEQFDKSAAKKFDDVIDSELKTAESEAKDIVTSMGGTPMSGWRAYDAAKPRRTTRGGAGWPGWNTGVIAAGVKASRAEGKVRRKDYTTSAGALLNTSAAGAIFEVAGRRSSGKGTGIQFIKNLNQRFGRASRDIWKIVDKDRNKIQKNVEKANNEALATLQRHLDREAA